MIFRAGLTLSLALVGGLSASLAGLPMGWLLGSLGATFTAALTGLPLYYPPILRTVVVLFIGITIGSGLSTELLLDSQRWLPSIFGLFISLLMSFLIGAFFLKRVGKFSNNTAYLAAYPGHLVLILQTAITYACDQRQITMTQSLRMLSLAVFLPAITYALISAPSGIPKEPTNWLALGLLTMAGVLGAFIARALRIPAALLIGTIIGSGAASLAGVRLGSSPDVWGHIILLLSGALIGTQFVGVKKAELLKMLPITLAAVMLTIAMTAAVAFPASVVIGSPFVELLMAYAPGGAEVMTLIAMATGHDSAAVGIHHMLRLVVMALALPLFTRHFLRS